MIYLVKLYDGTTTKKIKSSRSKQNKREKHFSK